ncbi:MAG: hypothetical protein EKK63_12160 [Acinetobacter sp.]|uniref:hypothetical protein n=1 Tax=Acinetobacter sp. TaxID=472 RepID=UPI000F9B0F14|nr:hypothetical protein [Acinetobacter sp.]RUP38417.1 MAG: hypothetical protein EKK63_12160 [Acinetobacter sp.]
MKTQHFDGKFLTVSLKFDENRDFQSVAGILDASNHPILKIEGKEFREEDISSVTVGDPKDYPYRRL